MLLILLLACTDPAADSKDTGTPTEDTATDTSDTDTGGTSGADDLDADGWTVAAGDCDDADPAIHPDAAETCDGVDQDCDGSTDEDATDAPLWYTDGDGDGYGDEESEEASCTQPAGTMAQGGDCDDTDPELSPDATEVCNGIDDNCDWGIDGSASADAVYFYLDADADGYGNGDVWVLDCTAPEGFVGDGTDCDDAAAAAYPGAAEVCNDEDDDCDGDTDEGCT